MTSGNYMKYYGKFSVTEDLMKTLETKRVLSIAYYPQTNSQMEQVNQEVKVFL